MADGKVVGIGGVFLRTGGPQRLSDWYREHLGIVATNGGEPDADGNWSWHQEAGDTVTAFFPRDNAYFPVDRAVMINFRVAGLEALAARLTAAGIEVERRDEWNHPEIGLFARIHDPDGNPIELWEPPAAKG